MSSGNITGIATLDDSALIHAIARSRDEEAFVELVRRYQTQAYNLASRITGDRSLGQDALQDAFLRIWNHADGFKDEAKARAWILKVVSRSALQQLKKQKRRRSREVIDAEIHPQGAFQGTPMEEREELRALRSLVNHLSIQDQKLVALYYGGGLSQEDVGQCLSITQRRVSARLRQVVDGLRTGLKQAGHSAVGAGLGAEALCEVLLSGYPAPNGMLTTLLERLDKPLEGDSEVECDALSEPKNISRNVYWAMVGVGVVLGVGLVLIPDGAFSEKAEGSPFFVEPRSTQAGFMAEKSDSTLMGYQWSYLDGEPVGWNAFEGQYKWVFPKGRRSGGMLFSSKGPVKVILPVEIQPRPFVMELDLAPVGNRIRSGSDWYSSENLRRKSKKRPNQEKVTGAITMRSFYIGKFQFSTMNNKLNTYIEYHRAYPATRVYIGAWDMIILGVRIRYLTPEEIPLPLRSPEALVEAWEKNQNILIK